MLRHAKRIECGITAAGETSNARAAFAQAANEGGAKKAAAACNQRLHASCSAAHTASFSRKILALCRMSTGKFG